MSPWEWSWSLEALAPVGLALAYIVAARPHDARAFAFLGGCALLVGALVSPLDTLARDYLVWAHLLQNVVLAEWAPLLLVVGLGSALADRLARNRVVAWLTRPVVALPVWIGTYAVWHVPVLYDAALRHEATLLPLEHATYVVSGVAFWWCVWQAPPHRLPAIARAAYVFGAFVLSAPLGLVLALVPEPLYDVLRGRARAGLGPVAARRPAARGHDDGRRAIDRVLRRVRLLVPPVPVGAGADRGSSLSRMTLPRVVRCAAAVRAA